MIDAVWRAILNDPTVAYIERKITVVDKDLRRIEVPITDVVTDPEKYVEIYHKKRAEAVERSA